MSTTYATNTAVNADLSARFLTWNFQAYDNVLQEALPNTPKFLAVMAFIFCLFGHAVFLQISCAVNSKAEEIS